MARTLHHLSPAALALLTAAGCAAGRGGPGPSVGGGEVLQEAELARVRCLLVAPLENGSSAPRAAGAATSAVLAAVDPSRTRVMPVDDLRGLLADTPLELPEGISTTTALELAELLGADAAMFGSVEGRARLGGPGLLVSLRLVLAGSRDLIFASSFRVEPAPGQTPEEAVAQAAVARARPMLDRLGGAGTSGCFPAARREQLRAAAVALRPPPPPPAAARPALPPPPAEAGPRAVLRTPRQREWARTLAEGGRLRLEDVSFEGRTAELARDGGLADLAVVLAATPGLGVRLEGFVDSSPDPAGDARLSLALARAAQLRLGELGLPAARVATAGRGSEQPLLPNFTARGRAGNRRVEAVPVR